MFCPNCGTQNPETAATCSKCNFALKAGAAAPKFKGTMLMMNQPGGAQGLAGIPGAPGGPGGPPLPGAGGPSSGAPGSGPASANPNFQAEAAPLGSGAPSAGAAPAPPPNRLKGTMVGVAPPRAGAAPAPPPQPPGTQAMPMPAQGPSPSQPDHQFGSPGVNALGSTVAIGDGGLPPGFALPDANANAGAGAPPPAAGAPPPDFGAPPPAGGAPGFGAPPPDFGAPPPGGAPPGGAPPGGAFGAPPQGAYGAPPGGAPPQDYGMGQPGMPPQQPGMQAPGGYGMQQYPGAPMMGPGMGGAMVGGPGQKSWLVTLLLCGFLGYLGAHRFYTGHYLFGGLQLITCGGFGIWALIDLIFILTGKYTDAQGRPLVKT